MKPYTLCAFADEASADIGGQIEALRRNEITLLEIRGVDGVNIGQISDAKAREVRRRLDDAGIRVWSIGSPIGKYALEKNFAPHLESFRRTLELADILGAERIRLFSFYPIEGESNESNLARTIERLDAFLSFTPESITLCHENEKKIVGENAENCLAIHQALPRLRAIFDPANFVQCGVDTLRAWEMLKGYVHYLHIKDAQADGVVVPAGEGIGNVAAIVKAYLAQGGDTMTLEPHLNAFIGLEQLENGESLSGGHSRYANNDEAFDAAARALNTILSA